MLDDLRRLMVAREQNIGKRLVIAQQHVEARAEALDEVGFEEQRFRFRARRHELHAGRGRDHAGDAVGVAAHTHVVGNARLEGAGLADVDDVAGGIDHAVDARPARQHLQVSGNDLGTGLARAGRRSGIFCRLRLGGPWRGGLVRHVT
jgi:hypothetical protein